jgi:hypothetical protein
MSQLLELVMIVKNSGEVLRKCLQSVKPYIDRWTILDTGSSDNTPEIIKEELNMFVLVKVAKKLTMMRLISVIISDASISGINVIMITLILYTFLSAIIIYIALYLYI